MLLLPAGALAAGKPAATHRRHHEPHVPERSRLTGKVNPSGAPTTIYFQYGPTKRYGAQTGPVPIGRGHGGQARRADVSGLSPKTTYHYRLVAENAHGVVSGADRTFTTKPQPLGLSLAATPNPVPFGGTTTLGGTLTGSNNVGPRPRAAGQPVPVHGRVPAGRQPAADHRAGRVRVPAAVGADQHAVPRRRAGHERGEPDRQRGRRRAREHALAHGPAHGALARRELLGQRPPGARRSAGRVPEGARRDVGDDRRDDHAPRHGDVSRATPSTSGSGAAARTACSSASSTATSSPTRDVRCTSPCTDVFRSGRGRSTGRQLRPGSVHVPEYLKARCRGRVHRRRRTGIRMPRRLPCC